MASVQMSPPARDSISRAVSRIVDRPLHGHVPNRLLLVEDDPAIANMFALGLTHAGYEVDIVESGGAALAALRANPADLVLLDVRLHGMDGLQVLDAIRADAGLRQTRVVMLSNFSEQDTVDACRERGALDYVFKWSLTPRELAQTCVRWLLE